MTDAADTCYEMPSDEVYAVWELLDYINGHELVVGIFLGETLEKIRKDTGEWLKMNVRSDNI